jgi:hypothetical protein
LNGIPRLVHFFYRWISARTGKVILTIVITIITLPTIFLIVIIDSGENLEFTTENHGEALCPNRLFNTGKACTVTPFI